VSTNDGYFEGRRVVGKPRGKKEGAVWKNAVYLLQIWNSKAAVTKREVCGKEIGEATTDNKKRYRGRRRKRSMASNDKTFGGG
jgi:hypothetical protein